MKKSNEFNNIAPNNKSQVKPLDQLITKKDNKKNDVSTASVYKTDNNVSARRHSDISKKSNSLSTLIKNFAVIASTLMIGIGGISLMPSPVNAKFDYVEAYDNMVYYQVSLSEYEEGLKVVLHNDFTNREQIIDDSSSYGMFEELQPDMYYTISIVKGLNVIVSEQIYTHFYEKKDYSDYDYNSSTEQTTPDNNTSDNPEELTPVEEITPNENEPSNEDPTSSNETGDNTSGDQP